MRTADPELAADALRLSGQVKDLFAQRQALDAELGEVLAQIHRVGVDNLFGFGRVDRWLEELLNVGRQEGRVMPTV